MASQFAIKLSIFVSGDSEGFPCEINLSEVLSQNTSSVYNQNALSGIGDVDRRFNGSHVCDDLDQALIYAEVSKLIPFVAKKVSLHH